MRHSLTILLALSALLLTGAARSEVKQTKVGINWTVKPVEGFITVRMEARIPNATLFFERDVENRSMDEFRIRFDNGNMCSLIVYSTDAFSFSCGAVGVGAYTLGRDNGTQLELMLTRYIDTPKAAPDTKDQTRVLPLPRGKVRT